MYGILYNISFNIVMYDTLKLLSPRCCSQRRSGWPSWGFLRCAQRLWPHTSEAADKRGALEISRCKDTW